jgi:hypothetical protein
VIYYIHRDPNFDRRLNMLRERGGTALIAVKKSEEIINRIIMKGRAHSHKIGKQTKNGELRIKHCIKYDLGNGYRLVCIRKRSHLTCLFVGNHDDCSRWIERKKGIKYEIDNNYSNMLLTKENTSMDFESVEEIDPAEEYEDNIMKRVNDKIIRTIFSGLVER